MRRNNTFKHFYQRYLDNELSGEELRQFLRMLQDRKGEEAMSALMDSTWEKMFSREETEEQASVVPLRSSGWQRWMAAAVVLLVLGTGAYFYYKVQDKAALAQSERGEKRYKNDISPGSDKALLTLGDGRQVVLDSTSGYVASEGGITVINVSGQLRYQSAVAGQTPAITYHTVSTPRGGQYQLVLPDGSKVWLNAASSLRFPTTFAGKSRVVELTGEGYFEVAHNMEKPFSVRVGELDVQVLGTHFNINSYADEEAIRTTLLEGSVRITRPASHVSAVLMPGQQVEVVGEDIRMKSGVDTEAVTAWKNGLFSFKRADIRTIMRQLSRWYDVEVEYQGAVTEHFYVEMDRNTNVSNVFKILEATGGVHFSVEGKKIIVMP